MRTHTGWAQVRTLECATHMEIGPLAAEAARRLAALTVHGGRMPTKILDYIVGHCEGTALN